MRGIDWSVEPGEIIEWSRENEGALEPGAGTGKLMPPEYSFSIVVQMSFPVHRPGKISVRICQLQIISALTEKAKGLLFYQLKKKKLVIFIGLI